MASALSTLATWIYAKSDPDVIKKIRRQEIVAALDPPERYVPFSDKEFR